METRRKRGRREEPGENKDRGCNARLVKRPEKKGAGCAGTGNVAQGARKCTEIVEGAKEETAARHFPRKSINKKVAQIRALYSQEERKKGRETKEQRRQRSGGHVASRRPENTGRGSVYPSSSSYDIDNSYVARNTRLSISNPFVVRSNTSLLLISLRFPFPPTFYDPSSDDVRVAIFTKTTRSPRLLQHRETTVSLRRGSLFSLRLSVFAFPLVLETRIAIIPAAVIRVFSFRC